MATFGQEEASLQSTTTSWQQEQQQRQEQSAVAGAAQGEKSLNIQFSDFLDDDKPWVLVENGSFLGYFDWVPHKLRVGDWKLSARVYLALICFAIVYFMPEETYQDYNENNMVPLFHHRNGGTSTATDQEECQSFHEQQRQQHRHYLQHPSMMHHHHHHHHSFSVHEAMGPHEHVAYTSRWYYNLFAFLWMAYILYQFVSGPAKLFVFLTYTIQSWTINMVRHGLAVLAPFVVATSAAVSTVDVVTDNGDDSSAEQEEQRHHYILYLYEALRFPALVTATTTFVVWNFVVAPYAYFVALAGSPEKKRRFLQFATTFRMVQAHVFNIGFAIMNSIIVNPRRNLVGLDLWYSFGMALGYILLYLLVLDRLGVHLYPVFSPRSHVCLVTWTLFVAAYGITYHYWSEIVERDVWRQKFMEGFHSLMYSA